MKGGLKITDNVIHFDPEPSNTVISLNIDPHSELEVLSDESRRHEESDIYGLRSRSRILDIKM